MTDISLAQKVSTTLSVATLLCGINVNAEEVTFTYTATVEFNPQTTVGIGGETAEDFFNEIVGPGVGTNGSFIVDGSFRWETTTPAFNSNALGAGYINAITGATLALGRVSISADINDIQSNASSSILGYNTFPCLLYTSPSPRDS